ncbi:bifunctional homocysteine S-methyltransferase/methylenetetrahydrofolate reductase [Chlorobiota bacterium]|nr:bifunctional homocysteine S-methyltransferase/methylenetetrahydrofolate reductase [Chlorobiota bacterium]
MLTDTFKDILGTIPIIASGSIAMELSLRDKSDIPADIWNLKDPVTIESIYREFVDAGATLLLTNTLKSNRLALDAFSLSDKVYEINRKAVWIARTAALRKALVAGVIGPTGHFFSPIGDLTQEEAHQVFAEQAMALLDSGADIIMLSSFIDIEELIIAIDAVRAVNPEIPIIALKSFPEDGTVLATSYPADIASRLQEKTLLALGSNGIVGPQRMTDILRALSGATIPLCILPDIAIPTLLHGRPNYNAEPEYVASVAVKLVRQGACIIGADGGATVEHIRAIAKAVSKEIPGSEKIAPKPSKIIDVHPFESDEKSQFAQNIESRFLTTVEVEIPRGLDMSSVLEASRFLKDHGIDAVNVFDGARARVRINPITASHMIMQETGMECITHMACRDRNMVGLQSDLIGAYSLGVKNILAVTGDPTTIGDYPFATSVYDVDSIGLCRALNHMNQGRDLLGNALGRATQFTIACAVNPCADDMATELNRLHKKVEEGATIAFTQPVFDMDTLLPFLDAIKNLNISIMLGIIPLRSARHADFLHYEVPGMIVPSWVREAMHNAGNSAGEIGLNIATEFLTQAKENVQGVYIMPPAKRYDMAIDMCKRSGIL